jgi:predicted Zn-dependent protease
MKKLLLACALVAACDSPTVPERSLFEVYEFRLLTPAPKVMRWPLGSTVRVFAAQDVDAARTQWLDAAVAHSVDVWNTAAIYREVQLEQVARAEDADVVVVYTSSTSPVNSSNCAPGGGSAYTTFCLDSTGQHLAVFPLVGTGGGDVKFLVTVRTIIGLDQAMVQRLVTHEIGHTLGIARHSPKPTDLMYTGTLQTDLPSAGDRATLQVLYHTQADITP